MADLKSIVQDGQFLARFWSRVEKTAACWIWQGGKDRDGYGKVTRWADGKSQTLAAHRVAAASAIAEFAPGLVVRHKCDNPICCNPDHLQMGTQADNIRDRDERGRGLTPKKLAHLRALAESRKGVPKALWSKKA